MAFRHRPPVPGGRTDDDIAPSDHQVEAAEQGPLDADDSDGDPGPRRTSFGTDDSIGHVLELLTGRRPELERPGTAFLTAARTPPDTSVRILSKRLRRSHVDPRTASKADRPTAGSRRLGTACSPARKTLAQASNHDRNHPDPARPSSIRDGPGAREVPAPRNQPHRDHAGRAHSRFPGAVQCVGKDGL